MHDGLVVEDRDAAGLHEDRRREVIAAFLSTGMTGAPSPTVMVTAPSNAQRAVAMHRERQLQLDGWLASEVRLPGIRENAAVLAALESSGWREQAAGIYRQEHPERREMLEAFLAVRDLS